jgi:hypothetical protein
VSFLPHERFNYNAEDAARLAEDAARRAAAATKDAAMLGDSGYERVAADAYFTPPENVDCLASKVRLPGRIWEPACGAGNITQRLVELGHEVVSSDLHTYGFEEQIGQFDFLAQEKPPVPGISAIVTNPPYGEMVEKFIRHSLKLMKPSCGMVAMFLRNEYDCGKGRMDLFEHPAFHMKIVVTKRPRWVEGSTGSPRHNYAWFIWDWRSTLQPSEIAFSHPEFAVPFQFDKDA